MRFFASSEFFSMSNSKVISPSFSTSRMPWFSRSRCGSGLGARARGSGRGSEQCCSRTLDLRSEESRAPTPEPRTPMIVRLQRFQPRRALAAADGAGDGHVRQFDARVDGAQHQAAAAHVAAADEVGREKGGGRRRSTAARRRTSATRCCRAARPRSPRRCPARARGRSHSSGRDSAGRRTSSRRRRTRAARRASPAVGRAQAARSA